MNRVFRFCGSILIFICAALIGRAAERQTLHGHVPPLVKHLEPIGRLSASTNLQLAIGLPWRNPEKLTNLLARIYDPSSPDYRHYLTPEQFAREFGPSEADYQTVMAFMQGNGLEVTATHPNRLLIDVSGSVADIERVFHVTIRVYQHPTEHRTFYAPDTEPSLDLSASVLRISGLDNYSLPRPRLRTIALVKGTSAMSNDGSGPAGTYMGSDFRTAYVPGTTLTGAGQSVGLLQFDGYTPADISAYEASNGLPSVTLSNVLIDGFNGQPSGSGGEVEVSLDIEMSISMAPGLTQVILYMAPNPSPFEDILNRMATDDAAEQLSCSWFQPNAGPDPVADEIFQQIAAQGQSFLNASGDHDAWTGLIDFPGETPYITQVGGTTLTTTGPGGNWVSETVWNQGSGIGSAGGISTNYPIPLWQTNVSMASNQGSTTMRNIPDVALTAENVYVRADGEDLNVGGTSCAAPLWAGFMALVNQQQANSSKAPLGFLNPAVYQIGTGGAYLSAFHDITTGNNTSFASPNKFFAAAGYDLCTGWGTPLGQGLIDALAPPPPSTPPSILAQPQDQTVPTGSNVQFFVTATGSLLLEYQWSFGGTNIDNATNSFLVMSNVQPFQAGNYSVQVTNGFGSVTSSNATLTVEPPIPPVIVIQPQDEIVAPGGVGFFSVVVTGTPPTYQWTFNGDSISGATNSYLPVFDVQPSNAGEYAVAVTNAGGWEVSSNASLSLLEPGTNCEEDTNGLVGWWAAEGDARNSMDGTLGQLVGGLDFAPGEIRQAFDFNGTDAAVQIGPSASLVVGRTNGVTIEAWVNPANVAQGQPLVEWSSGAARNGLMLWISIPANYGGNGPGSVVLDLADIGLGELSTPAGLIQPNMWQHVAATYDSSSGTAAIYIDGTLICQTNFRGVTALSSQTLWFGIDPTTRAFGAQFHYAGLMDEILLYNRALSAAEIQATYNSGNYGLCSLATTSVTIQPTNQVVFTGDTGTFSAIADGSPPLSVQWYFNGTNIPGSTDVTFTLANAQPSESGNYSVLVSNALGSALSSNAVLIVSNATPPVITLQPTNETAAVSNSVTFSVTATGTAPLIYQWTFNGANIARATNASLALTPVLFTNAGNYSVSITNPAGVTASSNAVLTVYPGWIKANAPTNIDWSCVASSADGSKLVAGSSGEALSSGGPIYSSADSGATWQPTSAPKTNNWNGIASSSDGSGLAAVNGTGIYLSTNSGGNWTKSTAPSGNWVAVACSSDGSRLVAAENSSPTSGIYTSANAGATWNPAFASTNRWADLASSSDGSKLVAVSSGGPLYVSTNSGGTWALTTNGLGWTAVASSADGVKLFATVGAGGQFGVGKEDNSGIYASTNSGTLWTLIPRTNYTTGGMAWSNVACSADGRVVVATLAGQLDQIYMSTDSGSTWRNAGAPSNHWTDVASSADGSKLVSVAGHNTLQLGNGDIYIWQSAPTLGAAISGNSLKLAWPPQWTGYMLQGNSDLTTTNWTDVPINAVISNGQNQVLISPTNGQSFYRLEFP